MRRRTSLLVGGAIAAALALGGLVGGVVAESRSLASAPAAPVALADRALAGAAGGISTSAVSSLEAEVRARPRDPALLTQLGFAYQLRWRETADPSYLPRSEAALRRAERFGVEDSGAVLGLGSLALIRHEFAEALHYGHRAERLLPGSSRPYGVIGDSLVELGRYDEAFAAFDHMVSLRPSLASYSRVAYARELVGDREGAVGGDAARPWCRRRPAGADGVGACRAREAPARARRPSRCAPACARRARRPSRIPERADRARADRSGRRGASPPRRVRHAAPSTRFPPHRQSGCLPTCSSARVTGPRHAASAPPSQ